MSGLAPSGGNDLDLTSPQISAADIEEALPRSRDRLEMQMQPRTGTALKKTAQQRKGLRKRAQISDHHTQLALFACRELRRMILENVAGDL